jgi:hypothetical protein
MWRWERHGSEDLRNQIVRMAHEAAHVAAIAVAVRPKAGRCLIDAPIENTGPLTVERMGDGNLRLDPVTDAD